MALMGLVSVACGVAAVGLWKGALWGRAIALTLLLLNLMGDARNALYRGDLRPLIGLIGAALILYLFTKRVRVYFQHGPRR